MLDGSFLTAITADSWRAILVWILLTGFTWAAFWYLIPYLRIILRLRSATESLRVWPESGEKRWTAPPTFPDHEGEPLPDAWTRFVKAWRNSVQSNEPMGPGSISPEEYFTQEVVLGKKNRGIPEALPGVFAGLGLLGTFIGITVGLDSIDINPGDPGRLMDGVTGLMDGMSAAFTTSIYGITFSLAWLLIFRSVRHQLQVNLRLFTQSVARAFPCEDPQTTLLRIATSSERVQASLQTLGDDIAEAMDRAMRSSVTPALESMSLAMTGLSAQLSEREFEGMEKIVENLRSSLSASVTEDLGRFAEALTDAADHQKQVSTDMEVFFGRLTEVGLAQTEMLEKTAEVSGTFGEGLESLESAQEAIRQVSTGVSEMMSSAAVLFEEARTQADSYREAAGSIHELLAGQLETTEQHVKGVFEFWESFDDKLEGMSAKMNDSLSELVGFSADKIREIFEAFDSEMATIVEHLGGTLAELRVTTEDLPSASQKIATSVAEIPTALTSASQGFRDLIEQSQKATESSEGSLKALASELDKVTQRTTGDLAAFSAELRKTTSDSATSLATLTESLPTISATSKDLAAEFGKTNAQLVSLQSELVKLREESSKRGFLGIRRNS
jgi:ABC-type transporter Mla subunit MlaD